MSVCMSLNWIILLSNNNKNMNTINCIGSVTKHCMLVGSFTRNFHMGFDPDPESEVLLETSI